MLKKLEQEQDESLKQLQEESERTTKAYEENLGKVMSEHDSE